MPVIIYMQISDLFGFIVEVTHYVNILENNEYSEVKDTVVPDRKAVSNSNLPLLEIAHGFCIMACSQFTSVSRMLTLRGNTNPGK